MLNLSILLKAKFEEQAIEDPYDSRPVDLTLVRGTRQMSSMYCSFSLIGSFVDRFVDKSIYSLLSLLLFSGVLTRPFN